MTTARRVGAIDIGTNSVLLLIAEAGPSGLMAVEEHATITRLGAGVDKHRRLDPAAVERTLACLQNYGERLRACGVTTVDAVGTSAMRDADGGEAFRKEAAKRIGVEPRVISGDEEASLTFGGALIGIPAVAQEMAPVVVFDIGGGSTEIIVGRRAVGSSGTEIEWAKSLDVGSVRLTERHVPHGGEDPVIASEQDAIEGDVVAALQPLAPPTVKPTLVGVAGTITTLAAIAHAVDPYDGTKIHGTRLPADELASQVQRLAALPRSERQALPGLEPKRADVIVAGGVIAKAVVDWAGADGLVVSDRGVRWGLAARLLNG